MDAMDNGVTIDVEEEEVAVIACQRDTLVAELRAAHLSEAAVDDFDTRWRIAYDYSAFEDPSRVGPFIFHGPEGIQLEDVQEVLNWFKLRYQPYQQGQQYEQEVWAEGPRLQGYIWGTPNTGTLCMLAALRSAGALLRYSKEETLAVGMVMKMCMEGMHHTECAMQYIKPDPDAVSEPLDMLEDPAAADAGVPDLGLGQLGTGAEQSTKQAAVGNTATVQQPLGRKTAMKCKAARRLQLSLQGASSAGQHAQQPSGSQRDAQRSADEATLEVLASRQRSARLASKPGPYYRVREAPPEEVARAVLEVKRAERRARRRAQGAAQHSGAQQGSQIQGQEPQSDWETYEGPEEEDLAGVYAWPKLAIRIAPDPYAPDDGASEREQWGGPEFGQGSQDWGGLQIDDPGSSWAGPAGSAGQPTAADAGDAGQIWQDGQPEAGPWAQPAGEAAPGDVVERSPMFARVPKRKRSVTVYEEADDDSASIEQEAAPAAAAESYAEQLVPTKEAVQSPSPSPARPHAEASLQVGTSNVGAAKPAVPLERTAASAAALLSRIFAQQQLPLAARGADAQLALAAQQAQHAAGKPGQAIGHLAHVPAPARPQADAAPVAGPSNGDIAHSAVQHEGAHARAAALLSRIFAEQQVPQAPREDGLRLVPAAQQAQRPAGNPRALPPPQQTPPEQTTTPAQDAQQAQSAVTLHHAQPALEVPLADPAPDSAAAASAGKGRNKEELEVAVLGQVTQMAGEGGQMFPRTVYHPQRDYPVCMLEIRELAKALGWSRHLGARAGSEDLCASLWKVLRDRGKEQGFSCASFPSPPQAHRISGSPQSVKYLLGLEHTQTIYFLSTKHERVLLDGFCQDLWPGEYEASTQKMRAFSAGWQRRKQGQNAPGQGASSPSAQSVVTALERAGQLEHAGQAPHNQRALRERMQLPQQLPAPAAAAPPASEPAAATGAGKRKDKDASVAALPDQRALPEHAQPSQRHSAPALPSTSATAPAAATRAGKIGNKEGSAVAVPGQVIEMAGEGGQMVTRTVYHLQGDDSVCMLEMRELAKALGWVRNFRAKASARDMCTRLWKVLRNRGKEQGFSCKSFPGRPQGYCLRESPETTKYLLGLEHVQTLYYLSTKHERTLLDCFCKGLWPGEYEAGMQKMQAFEAQMRKQGLESSGDGVSDPPTQSLAATLETAKTLAHVPAPVGPHADAGQQAGPSNGGVAHPTVPPKGAPASAAALLTETSAAQQLPQAAREAGAQQLPALQHAARKPKALQPQSGQETVSAQQAQPKAALHHAQPALEEHAAPVQQAPSMAHALSEQEALPEHAQSQQKVPPATAAAFPASGSAAGAGKAEAKEGSAVAVLGQATEMAGMGGQMYPRTVYHPQGDDSVCMLDIRELVKAIGWTRKFRAMASGRDMCRHLWKVLGDRGKEQGFSCKSFPIRPQCHRLRNGPETLKYLLTLDHIQTLYFLSNEHTRVLLDGFCQGLWPGEYEAGMQKMRAFEAQTRKQVAGSTNRVVSSASAQPVAAALEAAGQLAHESATAAPTVAAAAAQRPPPRVRGISVQAEKLEREAQHADNPAEGPPPETRPHDSAEGRSGQQAARHDSAAAAHAGKSGNKEEAAFAVPGQVTQTAGVGVKMVTRTVYHLQGDDSVCMLEIRELAKAIGWGRYFKSIASSRDTCMHLWKVLRLQGKEQGFSCEFFPARPQGLRLSDGSQTLKYLLGLDHIQTLYFLFNEHERALLDGFCEGVWPGEYEAGMRKMRAFEAQMRKQVPGSSASGVNSAAAQPVTANQRIAGQRARESVPAAPPAAQRPPPRVKGISVQAEKLKREAQHADNPAEGPPPETRPHDSAEGRSGQQAARHDSAAAAHAGKSGNKEASTAAMLGQVTDMAGEGGQMFPRTVYHPQGDASVCMLEMRELAKALGLISHFTAKASAKDMCASLWKDLRNRAKEQGSSCESFPGPPQAYRLKGSWQTAKYLLSLDHIQTLYFLSSEHERVLLDGFCKGLWPGEYEASMQKMPAFEAQTRKQVPGSSGHGVSSASAQPAAAMLETARHLKHAPAPAAPATAATHPAGAAQPVAAQRPPAEVGSDVMLPADLEREAQHADNPAGVQQPETLPGSPAEDAPSQQAPQHEGPAPPAAFSEHAWVQMPGSAAPELVLVLRQPGSSQAGGEAPSGAAETGNAPACSQVALAQHSPQQPAQAGAYGIAQLTMVPWQPLQSSLEHILASATRGSVADRAEADTGSLVIEWPRAAALEDGAPASLPEAYVAAAAAAPGQPHADAAVTVHVAPAQPRWRRKRPKVTAECLYVDHYAQVHTQLDPPEPKQLAIEQVEQMRARASPPSGAQLGRQTGGSAQPPETQPCTDSGRAKRPRLGVSILVDACTAGGVFPAQGGPPTQTAGADGMHPGISVPVRAETPASKAPSGARAASKQAGPSSSRGRAHQAAEQTPGSQGTPLKHEPAAEETPRARPPTRASPLGSHPGTARSRPAGAAPGRCASRLRVSGQPAEAQACAGRAGPSGSQRASPAGNTQARDGKRKRTFDPDTDICMGLLVLIQMDEEPNEYWDKPWSVGKVTELDRNEQEMTVRWMKPQRKERMWDSKWIPFLVEGRNTWKNKREKGYWYTEHIDTGTVQWGAALQQDGTFVPGQRALLREAAEHIENSVKGQHA